MTLVDNTMPSPRRGSCPFCTSDVLNTTTSYDKDGEVEYIVYWCTDCKASVRTQYGDAYYDRLLRDQLDEKVADSLRQDQDNRDRWELLFDREVTER